MRESIHKQGQILEILHNPHMDYDQRISAIREIVGAESKPMTRRIVQIATLLNPAVDGVRNNQTHLYALTDDSIVFVLVSDQYTEAWQRLPDIPQDEPAAPDPILELESKGGRLSGDGGYIVWGVPTGQITYEEGDGMFGAVTIAEIRAAAARLLGRIKGETHAT